MVSPFMPDAEKLAAVRALLPAATAGIYLNTGSAGPLSAEVAAAMAEQADRELAVGRGDPGGVADLLERMGEARAGVAAILATDIEAIALTHSTTDGMNAALLALPWASGDRVVTTDHEHPGGLGPILALRDRLGVAVDIVDVGGGRDPDAVLTAIGAAIGERTRAVALSHVLWTTGAVLPVAAIASVARERGAWTVVDGAQSVGAIPVAPDALGVDFYALPAQKWLLGPEGMGALWAGDRARSLRPALAGWYSFATVDRLGDAELHAGAQRFESSNYHRPSLVGFARACGWLSMYVGLPWAIERAGALARAMADRLGAIDGVELVTPRAQMATLVTFRIGGWPAERVMDELAMRVFAIARTVPGLDAVRLSVGWWITDEELDRVAEVVELLAAHTPDTLPPRARLVVLGSDGRPLG